MRIFWRLMGVLVVAIGMAQSSRAADWPQWRGPTADDKVNQSSGWPSAWPPKKLWTAELGLGCSTPVIVGDRVYVMGWSGPGRGRPTDNPLGQDILHCLDAATGRVLWKQSYPARYQGRLRAGDLNQYGGPNGSPAYDRQSHLIYTLGGDGDLRCWSAGEQGRLVWSINLYDSFSVPQRPHTGRGLRDYGYTSSPLLHGPWVIIEVGAAEGTVMAFDRGTGKLAWKSEYSEPAGFTGGSAIFQVEGRDCLAVFTVENVLVLRLDAGHEGRTVGTFHWRTDFACHVASPTPVGSQLLITSTHNQRRLALLDVTLNGITERWSSSRYATVCSPVVHKGRIYLVNGALECIDLADGSLLWRGGRFDNGSCLITADDKVLAFGAGNLVLHDAGADEYGPLAEISSVVPDICYPRIVLSGGRIYCKDRGGRLVCLQLAAE
jgi:outer membrane protein assembly factor BamB